MRQFTMNGNTKTAITPDIANRYTAILTYPSGKRVYLDTFYKTETAARNAAIRARARLAAIGERVDIATASLSIRVMGWSSPIKKGLYPTDFNHARDGHLEEYL